MDAHAVRGLGLAVALAAAAACAPASAAVFYFEADLDGPSEAPANASPATGHARVTFDDVAHLMRVEASFADLMAPNTAAHIHGPTALPDTGTAPVATSTPTFIGFPSGVTSGTFDATFDMTLASSYRAGFLSGFGGSTAAAEAALLGALKDDKAYFNIHTSTFPGGEIRGFLHGVPEPSSWALLILGFGLAGSAVRTRRRAAA